MRESWELPEDGTTWESKRGRVFTFDQEKAELAVRFITSWCRHLTGSLAGHPLELEPWQVWFVGSLFGWLDEDGLRRYRKAFLFIARKNGKSTLAAAIALYLLMGDQEPGAEVYSAAADTQQAQIVHRMAELMAKAEPKLSTRLVFRQRNILYQDLDAFYRVLSADAFTKHGLNPHGIVFDELHTQPNRHLWDVLDTATGAREQPLLLAISTAGTLDRESICWEQYEYACKVRDGELEDAHYLALIFEATPEDDWTDPDTWRKANPNMGVSVREDYLARQCAYAQEVPAYENTFKQLHLNMWTEQAERWIPMDAWRGRCLGQVDEKALHTQVTYGGLDLASTRDITALVLCFPRDDSTTPFPILTRFWCPEDTVAKRSREDKVPYDLWVRQGWMIATPGNVTDYEFIRGEIHELAEVYRLEGLAIDRWNATQLAVQLTNDGLPVTLMGQGFASMNAPSRELERRVVSGGLIHQEENPVLTWMLSNAARKMDPAGNIKPDKAKSGDRIDGVVALIMALDQAMRGEGPQVSIYESQELMTL